MSTNSQDQEIDLGQIGKGIQNFFQGIINSFFDLIFFLKKKIIIVGSLFIIGVALGYFLDKNGSYTQDILVMQNCGLYFKKALVQLSIFVISISSKSV